MFDDPLYSSEKDKPVKEITGYTLPDAEEIDITTVKPVLKTVLNPVEEVNHVPENSTGLKTVLKPNEPVKILTDLQPLFIDQAKLLQIYVPEKAAQIITDIQNNNQLSPEIAETLIKEKVISGSLSEQVAKTKNGFMKTLVNVIYNLIYS